MRWLLIPALAFGVGLLTAAPTTSPPVSGIVIVSSSGGGNVPFTALTTYFMASNGNDACNGTSAAIGSSGNCAWKTPNHSVHCGDVIIAATGTYDNTNFGISGTGTNGATGPWGTVSNCPSTSGGIDGAGGIYHAVVLCGGADLEACKITDATGSSTVLMTSSNWAMEGFKCTATAGGQCFGICACLNGTYLLHDNAFINNIAYNTQLGFWASDDSINNNVPGNGFDYTSFVGNIAQNAAQLNQSGGFICSAAMVFVGNSFTDAVAGTHLFMYGNFSFNNLQTCNSDVESMMLDTADAHGGKNQVAFVNNMFWISQRFGMQVFYQDFQSVSGQKVYILNNTGYDGGHGVENVGAEGNFNFQNGQTAGRQPTLVAVQKNISQTIVSSPGGGSSSNGFVYAILNGGAGGVGNTTIGTTGNENIVKGVAASCGGTCDSGNNEVVFDGNALGTNFYTDPLFANTTDLINNRSGVPSCTGFVTTTACMGWDANTSTLTTPSVISDLTASCTNCSGKGYQRPSTTSAAVQAPDGTNLWPSHLKGIVYLHWNGSSLTENADLVTKPSGM